MKGILRSYHFIPELMNHYFFRKEIFRFNSWILYTEGLEFLSNIISLD
jgi:hypothetical protein